MKTLYTLIPLIAACTASTGGSGSDAVSKQNARSAVIIASSAFSAARSGASVRSLTSDVHFSDPCNTSGEIAVDGTFDQPDDLHRSFDLIADFAACSEDGEGALDGDLHWVSNETGADLSFTLTGTLDWTEPGLNASCAFDLHVEVTDAGASISGTACGYNATELGVDAGDFGI